MIGIEPVVDICGSIVSDKPLSKNSMELLTLLINSDYFSFCLNKPRGGGWILESRKSSTAGTLRRPL